MTVSTLNAKTALEPLRSPIVYSLAKLEAHPLTAVHGPRFVALLGSWDLVSARERQLTDAITRALARVDGADELLDALVDAVVAALLVASGNKRGGALWKQFLGSKTPAQLKRPILGDELEHVRSWIAWLASSTIAVLKELAARAADVVKNSDDAVEALRNAEDALLVFRLTGERRAWVDEANAVRKSTFGDISKLPHEPAGAGLPVDFGDGFFPHDSHKATALTLATAKARIKALQALLDSAKKDLVDLEAEEAELKKEAATESVLLDEVVVAEKAAQDANERLAALRKKAGK
jgi:hypothetical protein